MKLFLTPALLFFSTISFSNPRDSVIDYTLPDSVKAVSFMADISVVSTIIKKEIFAGIKTDVVKLLLEADKKEREVVFEFPSGSQIMANGNGIKIEKDELSWKHAWKENETYRLMIATAGDSAGNFALYSGYVFLPGEKKWKLIGTCKILGQCNTLKQPSAFYSNNKKDRVSARVNEAWIQRNNGSWKNLTEKQIPVPVVNLLSHVDSLQQLELERKELEKLTSYPQGYKESGGVYYKIIKEGPGKLVSINDTVVVHYKGHVFNDNTLFDQTKETPATFPLRRLITGWQIALQFCKVGGKVQVIIPSNLAYSIRTRSAKIPPNSILVFEIEVVDVKTPR